MSSISTKKGDQGNTYLANGKKIGKDMMIFEVIGTLDQFNAWLGLLGAEVLNDRTKTFLKKIQRTLFVIGSWLAGYEKKIIDSEQLAELEEEIDFWEKQLPPLTHFILPGGSLAAAHCHVVRCVCRRVERLIVAQSRLQPQLTELIPYFNRLSDYLFLLARAENFASNIKDEPALS